MLNFSDTSYELSSETHAWFQRMTDSHKKMYQDEEYRKSIEARLYSVSTLRPHVDFDVEPD